VDASAPPLELDPAPLFGPIAIPSYISTIWLAGGVKVSAFLKHHFTGGADGFMAIFSNPGAGSGITLGTNQAYVMRVRRLMMPYTGEVKYGRVSLTARYNTQMRLNPTKSSVEIVSSGHGLFFCGPIGTIKILDPRVGVGWYIRPA
jgi:hypothetical protein